MRYAKWYELDGIIVRKSERQRMVKQMWVMNNGAQPDPRPVCLRVNAKKNTKFRRRVNDREQKVPR